MSDSLDETFGSGARGETARLRKEVEALRKEVGGLKRTLESLAGDGDVSQESGYIEVDHDVPTHPVVRFRADRLPEGGGSITLVVNDTSYSGVKKLELVSAQDSNVIFNATTSEDDSSSVKLAIGVHYI